MKLAMHLIALLLAFGAGIQVAYGSWLNASIALLMAAALLVNALDYRK